MKLCFTEPQGSFFPTMPPEAVVLKAKGLISLQ